MQYFIINAFTAAPFTGNPAAVVVPVRSAAKELSASQMQRLAAELSPVETCFVLPPTQPKTDFELRFFSRAAENPFCGHATLGAAHILMAEFGFRSNEFLFTTKGGIVIVRRTAGKTFELDLRPSLPQALPTKWDQAFVARVVAALHIEPTTSATPVPVPVDVVFHQQSKNLILLFPAAWCIVAARPRSHELRDAAPQGVSKVTITAIPCSEPLPTADLEALERPWREYSFVTRLFAPWFGIEEDAVSGASHAILARMWAAREERIAKLKTLRCFQPSPRGGEVLVNMHDPERIGICGEVVTIAHGTTSFQASKL